MSPRSLIAFDFGLKHIGVAKGQNITKTASPLCVLKAKEGQPNWQQVDDILQQWQPDLVIVGLPLNMDGSVSEMSKRAMKFANRVHGRFGVAVETVDERLSSYEAKGEVIEHHQTRDFGSNTVDAIAAQLILQSWFNQQN